MGGGGAPPRPNFEHGFGVVAGSLFINGTEIQVAEGDTLNGVPGADTSGFFAAIKLDGEGSSALLPALAEVFDQVFRSVNARRAESGDGSSLVDVLAIPRNS